MPTGTIADTIQNTRTLLLAHTVGVTAEDIIVSNNNLLVAVNTALANAPNAYVWMGKVIFPKATGKTFSPGDRVYWDAGAGKITDVASGNTFCGLCIEPAASADTSIVLYLLPNLSVIPPSIISLASAHVLVGDGSGKAADVAMTGDVTISNTGATSIGAGKITDVMRAVATKVVENTDGNITVLAADLLKRYFEKTGCTAGRTLTFDTPANIQAAFVATTGARFRWLFANTSGQTITLTAVTGLTLKGTAAVPTGKTAIVEFVNTGAGTIDVVITLGA